MKILTNICISSALLLCSTFSMAQEKQFDRIVVFGTSLSDPGNAFVLLSDPYDFGFDEECNVGTPANVPPYDQLEPVLLIPKGSYAKGGHHVSNGATWIEQFARGRGLSGNTRPALRNAGTNASNYAVGGARALDHYCRFNLSDQLAVFEDDSFEITEKTLFVFEMGSNDVMDALYALAAQDPDAPSPIDIIGNAVNEIYFAIQSLYSQGARRFLLVNVPAVGETPAVKALNYVYPGTAYFANLFSEEFNYFLAMVQANLNDGLEDVDIRTLDLYTLFYEVIADPESFGISNTEDACITPGIAPFKCKKPDTYLFWDGIHPSKAVHDIMAQKTAEVLMD